MKTLLNSFYELEGKTITKVCGNPTLGKYENCAIYCGDEVLVFYHRSDSDRYDSYDNWSELIIIKDMKDLTDREKYELGLLTEEEEKIYLEIEAEEEKQRKIKAQKAEEERLYFEWLNKQKEEEKERKILKELKEKYER